MVMTLPATDSVLETLLRHQSCRSEGIPSVSTLLAPTGLALRVWRDFCTRHRREIVLVEPGSVRDAGARWLEHLCASGQLTRAALHLVATALDEDINITGERLANQSQLERRLLLERITGKLPQKVVPTLERLLIAEYGEPVDARRLDLDTVGTILGKPKTPSILVLANAIAAGQWPELAAALTHLVTDQPWMSVAVVGDPVSFDQYLAQTPESHAKATLRASVIRIEGLDRTQIRDQLAERGGVALNPAATVEALVRNGATGDDVDQLADAAIACRHAASEPQSLAASDNARSEAERFLYQQLQGYPPTTDLFELAVKPGFVFGKQPAELDLACRRHRVAIEIDGYYHFTSLEHYRRDRRKDVLLQQHGYLVLRFLAEDVVADLESILRTVEAAVCHRKSMTEEELRV